MWTATKNYTRNFREVLLTAAPLIMAAMGHAINLFVDRLMLANYSSLSVSAAFPAGLTAFALSCIFVGTIGYSNTFIAQYFGAQNYQRIGTAVWQGIFIALFGGVIMMGGYFWARPLFDFFGHQADVRVLEVQYHQIICMGMIFMLLSIALGAFWSGRGKTSMVMWTNIIVTAINIPCNYVLIFGYRFSDDFIIPEMGIAGAAYGTLFASFCGMLMYAIPFLARANNRQLYRTATKIWDWQLCKRMLRFGTPSGVQLFLDLTSFNVFVILLGNINIVVQEAASIAFGLNALAFIPMIGLGQTVAILVGQAVGARDIKHAEQSVRSALVLILLYMSVMAFFFIVHPELILSWFVRANDEKQIEVMIMAKYFLYFIATYLLFDGLFVVYCNAIKGAGDTRFAMWMGSALAWLVFAIPCLLCYKLGGGVWHLWSILVIYVIFCGAIFYYRYRTGLWKKMRVIE